MSYRCFLRTLCVPIVCVLVARAHAVPHPDHVVIVIEENHSFSNVIGSASAPYMNRLVAAGASFNNMYGITHPSQGNYIQFFSGENQGVLDDTVPPTGTPFTAANLGAALRSVGKTFGGYSEGLPATGSTAVTSGNYVLRHNPWVNWQADPPGTNQLPSSVNMPFTSFPTDFNQLPSVSIVVPDLQHDMHDGTIAQADTWLQTNLSAYENWAQTHNSMLIVTWDEDSFASRNHIPTIISGPMVKATTNNSTWTLHNITRTVADMFGATPPGSIASVSPITGVFTTDPATTIRSFQQGVNGYTSAHDTYIEAGAPTVAHAAGTAIGVDGSPLTQGLIRFDNIIGSGAGQVAQGSQVISAKLVLLTGNVSGDGTTAKMSLFPMLNAWSDTATWDSLVGGVSTNGIEASSTSEFGVTPTTRDIFAIFDVTKSLQQWVLDPTKNNGWLLNPSGTDGWNFDSSEFATLGLRPMLEVTLRDLVHPWQNPTLTLDTDNNGNVEALDVLQIVNSLNSLAPRIR